MAVQAISGPVIDVTGRKVAVIFALACIGLSLGFVPCFTELYPGFLIICIAMAIGNTIGRNLPLIPDYVAKDSIGTAQACNEVVATISTIFTNSGLFALHNLVSDQKFIYFGVSSLIFTFLIFNIFAIKNVEIDSNSKVQTEVELQEHECAANHSLVASTASETKRKQSTIQKVLNVLRVTWNEFRKDPGYAISLLNSSASIILGLAVS